MKNRSVNQETNQTDITHILYELLTIITNNSYQIIEKPLHVKGKPPIEHNVYMINDSIKLINIFTQYKPDKINSLILFNRIKSHMVENKHYYWWIDKFKIIITITMIVNYDSQYSYRLPGYKIAIYNMINLDELINLNYYDLNNKKIDMDIFNYLLSDTIFLNRFITLSELINFLCQFKIDTLILESFLFLEQMSKK